jgi:hypothetical protein
MTLLKMGDRVKQVVKPIEGTVADVRYYSKTGTFEFLVNYTTEDGTPSQRWFQQKEVEAA